MRAYHLRKQFHFADFDLFVSQFLAAIVVAALDLRGSLRPILPVIAPPPPLP